MVTVAVSVEQRIDEASDGLIGLMAGLMATRQQFGQHGDRAVNLFLDSVPERGEALWKKFTTARDAGEATDFVQFVAKIITPKLMGK